MKQNKFINLIYFIDVKFILLRHQKITKKKDQMDDEKLKLPKKKAKQQTKCDSPAVAPAVVNMLLFQTS